MFDLPYFSEFFADFGASGTSLALHSTVPTATIDFTTGSVTKDLFGEMATIKARKVNDSTFEAIIVPQRLDTRRPFIEIIAGGISYLLEDTFQFKPGMQHTLSLTINSNPDQIEIEIGGDIEDGDWNVITPSALSFSSSGHALAT